MTNFESLVIALLCYLIADVASISPLHAADAKTAHDAWTFLGSFTLGCMAARWVWGLF